MSTCYGKASYNYSFQWIPEPPPEKKSKRSTKKKQSLLMGFGASSIITDRIDEDVSRKVMYETLYDFVVSLIYRYSDFVLFTYVDSAYGNAAYRQYSTVVRVNILLPQKS